RLADVPGPFRILAVVSALDDLPELRIAREQKDLRSHLAGQKDRLVNQHPIGFGAACDDQDRGQLVHGILPAYAVVCPGILAQVTRVTESAAMPTGVRKIRTDPPTPPGTQSAHSKNRRGAR